MGSNKDLSLAVASELTSLLRTQRRWPPLRFRLEEPQLSTFLRWADELGADQGRTDGPWYVKQGHRWLLHRREDARSVALVCREEVTIVVDSLRNARAVADLLNRYE